MRNSILVLAFLSLSFIASAQKDVKLSVFNAEKTISMGTIPGKMVLIRPDSIMFLYNTLLERLDVVQTSSETSHFVDSCSLWIASQTGGDVHKSNWKQSLNNENEYNSESYNINGYKAIIMRIYPGRYRFSIDMPELKIDTVFTVGCINTKSN
jgi:hypothetical protein